MNKLALTAVLVFASASSQAGELQYQAADNSAESKLCVKAATASKIDMYVAVRDFRTYKQPGQNFQLIANELTCNGVNVAEFAKQAGNDAVAKKLNGYRQGDVTIREIAQLNAGTVLIGGSK